MICFIAVRKSKSKWGAEMLIKLDKDFYIEIDDLNHILKQRYKRTSRDGEEKDAEKVLGYFPDVEACVEKYIDARQKLLAPDKTVTLREYVNLVKKSNNEAVKAIKQHCRG